MTFDYDFVKIVSNEFLVKNVRKREDINWVVVAITLPVKRHENGEDKVSTLVTVRS